MIYILLITTHFFSFAQNIIPNSDFEEVTGCPSASASLSNIVGWHRLRDHNGTPDQFYGDCGYNGINNSMAPGQRPFSGNGYVGCFAYGDDLREYFTSQLTAPMVKDSVYSLTFFVLPAAGYGTMINSFGVHFSREAPCGNNDLKYVPLSEHIGNPENRVIKDTVNWTKISGTYTARGGERYITFGNFRNDGATVHEMIKEKCIRSDRSYILVDGVKLVPGDTCDTLMPMIADSSNLNNTSYFYKDERLLIQEKTFTTQKHKIRISVWDDKRTDGDSIHLSLNDSLLLQNHLLTKRHHTLEIDVLPGEHLLKLVALNLGEIPPNTAAVKISDLTQHRTYILKSDLFRTEGIKIIVSEE